jgi:hypothetical protein
VGKPAGSTFTDYEAGYKLLHLLGKSANGCH